MKLKKLIIVSLILAIFAIGAVSASQDVASDDSLAVDDIIDDSIEEVDDGDDALGYDASDCRINENGNIIYNNDNDELDPTVVELTNDDITGDLKVSVDDVEKYSRKITKEDYVSAALGPSLKIKVKDLGITTTGQYKINVNIGTISKEGTFNAKLVPNVQCPSFISEGDSFPITISYSSGSGVAKLYAKNSGAEDTYIAEFEIKDGKGSYSLAGLTQGSHELYLNYTIDGTNYESNLYPLVEKKSSSTGKSASKSTSTAKKIVKKNTKIVAVKKTFKKSKKTKKYTITLKSGKKLVKNAKITLKIKKKLYTARTNKKGKATFYIKNLKKKGKYTAVIKFAGSKYYNKSTKKIRITVKK